MNTPPLTRPRTVYTVSFMTTTAEPRFGQVWEYQGHRLLLRSRSSLGTDLHGAVASVVGWNVEDLTVRHEDNGAIGWIVEEGLVRDGLLFANPGC
jgi:hypothetical protein